MELEAETGSLGYVIIGIGINLRQNEADFGPEVAPTAISLQQALGRAPDRTELAAAVLLSLDKLYQDFPERAQGYLERFRRDCLTLCRPVRVLYPGGTREGTAVDITEDFGPHRPLAGRNGGSRDLRGGLRPRAVRVRIRE